MSHINYRYKEITLRIAYYGPGLSGSAINLNCIHTAHDKYCKGDIIALDTEKDGTLLSNSSPMELGQIEGYTVRFGFQSWSSQARASSISKKTLTFNPSFLDIVDI